MVHELVHQRAIQLEMCLQCWIPILQCIFNIEYFQSLVPSKKLDQKISIVEKGHSERQKYRIEQAKIEINVFN